MSIELKVKAKSLGEESKIIRREEHKLRRQIKWHRDHQNHDKADRLWRKRMDIAEHRRVDVRQESRATHLARAYIKGIPYRKVEASTHSSVYDMAYIKGRVEKLVKKYGQKPVETSKIMQWFNTE